MKREIHNELRDLGSRLAELPRRLVYTAPPPGYFEGLATQLQAGVAAAGGPDPELPIGKEMPFETPAGYFEGLNTSLLDTAAGFGEERRDVPFESPAGYLANLPQIMLEAARAQQQQQRQPQSPTRRSIALPRRVIAWTAAAAGIAGIWFGLGPIPASPSADRRAETALAKLSSDSIGAYVERHADEFDTETLESSLAGSQVTDFRKVVSELRNDEIEQYLNDDEPLEDI